MSAYNKLTLEQKLAKQVYHKKWRDLRRGVKKSIFEFDIPPPIRPYIKKKLQPALIVEPETDSNNEDNDSITSDITDNTECSLIQTTYEKSSHLKSLDNQLREILNEKNINTHEQIANLFQTFKNINTKYGLPSLENRNEHNLAEFYNNTIFNLK